MLILIFPTCGTFAADRSSSLPRQTDRPPRISSAWIGMAAGKAPGGLPGQRQKKENRKIYEDIGLNMILSDFFSDLFSNMLSLNFRFPVGF